MRSINTIKSGNGNRRKTTARRGIDPSPDQSDADPNRSNGPSNEVAEIGRPFTVKPLDGATASKLTRYTQTGGRRTREIDTPHGHYVRAERPRQPLTALSDIALDSSLRAVAQRQATTGQPLTFPVLLGRDDLRRKVREAKVGNLILFVVDGSGSMGAQKRMSAVKGAIFSLLLDAYQKRDQVGMILFRGKEAKLLLPPTNSVDIAHQQLAKLPTGGRTPLAQGLLLAEETLGRYANKIYQPLLVVVSDGRANVPIRHKDPLIEVRETAHRLAERKISALVLDCETGRRKLGLARPLATALRGQCLPLADLSAAGVARSIRDLANKEHKNRT